MAGRNDVRRERSWDEQNEDNYWSGGGRFDDRDRRDVSDRGRDDRRRDDRDDRYGQGPVDTWGKQHDYNDSFDRTWHGAHGADRDYNRRSEDLRNDRIAWERYNGLPPTAGAYENRSRIDEDRARWDNRYSDERRWEPSRGMTRDERREGWSEHGRDVNRHDTHDRRNVSEDRYRGAGYDTRRDDDRGHGRQQQQMYSGDRGRQQWGQPDGRQSDNRQSDNRQLDNRQQGGQRMNDERSRRFDEENRRYSEPHQGNYDPTRSFSDRDRDHREENRQQRGNPITWRDFDSWSDDRIQDSRHRGIGYSRGDDYHDRFWSEGDRHRDAW